eukprot:scaffold7052_cov254-Pinguiococcus_pyrenoidosus.AAC.40
MPASVRVHLLANSTRGGLRWAQLGSAGLSWSDDDVSGTQIGHASAALSKVLAGVAKQNKEQSSISKARFPQKICQVWIKRLRVVSFPWS